MTGKRECAVVRVLAIAGFVLLGLAIPASAGGGKPEGAAAIAQGQLLRGQFAQERFLTGFAAPLNTTGSFVLVPGEGLIWRAEKPFALTTVMSPAGLMQEVDGKETLRLPSTKIPFMTRMYAMLGGALTGDWGELSAVFAIARKEDAKGWRVELTPLEDDPAVPVRMIIAKGSRLLDEIEMIKPDGDRDRIVFSAQKLETAEPSTEDAKLLEAVRQL